MRIFIKIIFRVFFAQLQKYPVNKIFRFIVHGYRQQCTVKCTTCVLVDMENTVLDVATWIQAKMCCGSFSVLLLARSVDPWIYACMPLKWKFGGALAFAVSFLCSSWKFVQGQECFAVSSSFSLGRSATNREPCPAAVSQSPSCRGCFWQLLNGGRTALPPTAHTLLKKPLVCQNADAGVLNVHFIVPYCPK